MPTNTPNLTIPKPLGTETVSRANFEAAWDAIDANAAKKTDLTAHTAATTAHGAVSAPTASTIVVRDANGRAQVATPAAAGDIATKGYVDTNVDQGVKTTDKPTFAGFLSTAYSQIKYGGPRFEMWDTGGAADSKRVDMLAGGGSLAIRAVNDADSVANYMLRLSRAGVLTLGDSAHKVWSDADAPKSLAGSGYQKLPSGLIIQWGITPDVSLGVDGGISQGITFPIAFPTACLQAISSGDGTGVGAIGGGIISYVAAQSTTGVGIQTVNKVGSTQTLRSRWWAIGY
jgi:hypothetical protein